MAISMQKLLQREKMANGEKLEKSLQFRLLLPTTIWTT